MTLIDENLLKPVRGMKDYLPDEYYPLLTICEKFAKVAESYGYLRVETPALEHFEILKLKAGDEIINEIYYFKDKAGREVGLRFDMTVPIARIVAYRQDIPKPIRWYYISKVWRYDEPQHGRFREFHQFGVEHIGSSNVKADVEVINLAIDSLKEIELENFKVYINDREIVDYLLNKLNISKNIRIQVLRVLDKRDKVNEEELKKMLLNLGLESKICDELITIAKTKIEFEKIPEILYEFKIPENLIEKFKIMIDEFKIINPDLCNYLNYDFGIVRGLDYYTGIVFEIYVHDYKLAIGGGGRYDDLIQLYRGIKIPALGFAFGLERILEILQLQGKLNKSSPRINYYIYVIGNDLKLRKTAYELAKILRIKGFKVIVDLGEKSLRSALDYASRIKVEKFIIIGPKEFSEGKIKIRDLDKWIEETIDLRNILKAEHI